MVCMRPHTVVRAAPVTVLLPGEENLGRYNHERMVTEPTCRMDGYCDLRCNVSICCSALHCDYGAGGRWTRACFQGSLPGHTAATRHRVCSACRILSGPALE